MRETLRDVPIVGTAFAGATDLLLFGGETIVALAFVLVETLDVWIPFLSYLSQLAESTGWIPEESVETLLLIAIAAFTVILGIRIVRRLISGIQANDENET